MGSGRGGCGLAPHAIFLEKKLEVIPDIIDVSLSIPVVVGVGEAVWFGDAFAEEESFEFLDEFGMVGGDVVFFGMIGFHASWSDSAKRKSSTYTPSAPKRVLSGE